MGKVDRTHENGESPPRSPTTTSRTATAPSSTRTPSHAARTALASGLHPNPHAPPEEPGRWANGRATDVLGLPRRFGKTEDSIARSRDVKNVKKNQDSPRDTPRHTHTFQDPPKPGRFQQTPVSGIGTDLQSLRPQAGLEPVRRKGPSKSSVVLPPTVRPRAMSALSAGFIDE